MMNINAKKGAKVKYRGTGGFEEDKEYANKYLNVDDTYTVLNIKIRDWHTDVFLQELPNLCFNSVLFDELK